MGKIKAAFAEASAWLDRCWTHHGSAAMLAFFIAFAVVLALGARR